MIDCIKQGGGQLPLVGQIQMCCILEFLSKLMFFSHTNALDEIQICCIKMSNIQGQVQMLYIRRAIYTVHLLLNFFVVLLAKKNILQIHTISVCEVLKILCYLIK